RVTKAIETAIDTMKSAGATIVDPADLPPTSKYGDAEFDVLLYEFKADLAAHFAWVGEKSPMKTLADVIRFNDAHRDAEMPFFDQEIFVMAEAKGPLTDAKYLAALKKCRMFARTQGIDLVMTQHKLDALVAPTAGPAWFTDHVNGDSDTGGSTTPAAVAGYPSITVPAAFVMGLPVGISFFGRAWSEGMLIRLAYAFEQATKTRRAPDV
ncbi:MAG: amidase family protein, partial [Vicinamibacterales bacterium]